MDIVDGTALLVQAEEPAVITSVIPRSKECSEGVAVYWGLREAQALASLGFSETPSPILKDYHWSGPYDPFAHQKVTASFMTLRKRAFCFSEQGTGKTASVIWAADYLLKQGKVNRVLVLCPLSIMKAAWQADMFRFAMHRSCGVAHGDAKKREAVIKQGAEFIIMNYEGLATVEQAVIDGGFDMIVIDEASKVKNVQTKLWKTVNRVVSKLDPYLWLLTGTPAAQSPLDAYGLAKLVNPKDTPKYFGEFRDKVMYRVSQFKWMPKASSESYVHSILQPAIRFERKDCLDLPEVTHTEREAPMTPQQKKFYERLKHDMVFDTLGETVTAAHAATRINKLLQIASGCVYTDEGEVIEFDVANRLSAVVEAIEEASHKVLVFVPFNHTIDLLKDRLDREGITCGVINGKVSVNRRSDLVETFQTAPDPRVMIIQPQAAAHGLTLTEADTIIWYAPITSVETYLQANARINRPGQKNAMSVIHIKGSPVEEKLYSMLQGNINTHNKLIDLYRATMEE